MIFAPRSWPSRPGFAITTRIFRAMGGSLRGETSVRPVDAPAREPAAQRDAVPVRVVELPSQKRDRLLRKRRDGDAPGAPLLPRQALVEVRHDEVVRVVEVLAEDRSRDEAARDGVHLLAILRAELDRLG